MICSKCRGDWKYPIIGKQRVQVCSKCGFHSNRSGNYDGLPFGLDSPVIGNPDFKGTLFEYLGAWWKEKRND